MLLFTSLASAEFDPSAYHVEVLHAHGIPTNAEGLGRFLDEVIPDENRSSSARELLWQMSSDDYSERVYAGAALGRTVPFPHEALRQAVSSADLDLSRRAQEILLNRRDEFDYLVYAALETIAEKRVPGLVPRLAKLMPACVAPNQQIALRFALVKSATAEDRDALIALLEADDPRYRVMAVHALTEVNPSEAPGLIRPLLQDEAVNVRTEAASRLAQSGQEDGFRVLIDLLDAEEAQQRGQAAWALRIITGKALDYSCHDALENRRSAIARWRQWFDAQQGEFRVAGRLQDHYLFARTMVSLFHNDRVEELDLAGNVVGTITGYQHPWAVQLLPNGHKLVSWRDEGQCLTEYDLAGREIWRSEVIFSQPRSIQLLPDGNLWMTCNSHPKTIVMDRAGNHVRERPFDPSLGQLKDGELLSNGHTVLLFTDKGLVREIDANGIIVREIEGLDEPYSIQGLPDGHLLIAEGGKNRVIEVNKDSETVWSVTTAEKPRRTQRLPNGNTLISSYVNLVEVTPGGKTVWERKVDGPARAWRF